jgi:sodium pump decarboxylase gamma subunit
VVIVDFSANVSRFVDGISTFFIGIAIVFAVLVLLIFIIQFISKVVASIENKDKSVPEKVNEQPVVPATAPVATQRTDDLELVAVITAAIAASMGTTSDRLQVRSLRKVERIAR